MEDIRFNILKEELLKTNEKVKELENLLVVLNSVKFVDFR